MIYSSILQPVFIPADLIDAKEIYMKSTKSLQFEATKFVIKFTVSFAAVNLARRVLHSYKKYVFRYKYW